MENYDGVGLLSFYGGQSIDKKLGTKSQFYNSRRIDFRKSPNSFTILPQPSKTDGGAVTDLVQAMTQVSSGDRYSIGDTGNVYKTSSSGVWSDIINISENGSAGIMYRQDVDHVYIAGQTKIARIQRVSTTNQFQTNWFNYGASTCSTCTKTGGTEIYTLSTVLNESDANKRNFTSDIEPLYKIGVKIRAKGTGNWTLTLHDDTNNVLGTASLSNGSITEQQVNYFVFSGPISIQRGADGKGSALTYHFHLTSTVADGTVATTTKDTLADCDMELWAYALTVPKNGLHPMINFSQYTLIGNGRYVTAYEPLQDNPTTADFLRHRITLPPGFEVCGFAQKNLMCVIGAEKRSTSGEFQEGALFFWDGVADTYNDWWLVPEGSPESLFSHKNIVYFVAGGALYRMKGGDEPIKIRTFRGTDSEYSNISDTTRSNPNMMGVRRGILLVAYPTQTTNPDLEHSVFSLGAISREYPESWGMNYSLSTGNMYNDGSNNLRIGMIKNYGDTLFMSWRDDSASPKKYGVDIVNNSSVPATNATIETLKFDDNRPAYQKRGGFITATFNELPAGTTVKLKYKIDGEADWHYSEPCTSGTSHHMPVGKTGGTQFFYIEFGIDIETTGDTPEFNSLYLFFDHQKNRSPIGG